MRNNWNNLLFYVSVFDIYKKHKRHKNEMNRDVRLVKKIINESVKKILHENTQQHVDVNTFIYKGKNLQDIGEGESFCYCPCDINGTPKMYYANSHYTCAGISIEDILKSFGGSIDEFDFYELDDIVSTIWINARGRGRVFYDRYIVVGEDGHIPNKEYIDGIISILGGTYDDYVVAYNNPTMGVSEMSCRDAFRFGKNDKPNTMDVPEELIELYNEKMAMRQVVNKRFPTNMTRAQYYSLLRQESRKRKNTLIY